MLKMKATKDSYNYPDFIITYKTVRYGFTFKKSVGTVARLFPFNFLKIKNISFFLSQILIELSSININLKPIQQ